MAKIVAHIKAKGLDGIAITEHWDKDYGFRVKEIVEESFGNEVLIIPGQELDNSERHVVELYLPNGATFRFLGHPGFPTNSYTVEDVQGIEIESAMHGWHIDKEKVKALAEEHDLLLLRNSDAHSIDWIGRYYNEIDLEDLIARAK